jgi:hypothetical protein
MAQGNVLSQFGTRYLLPMGTVRQMNEVPIHLFRISSHPFLLKDYRSMKKSLSRQRDRFHP